MAKHSEPDLFDVNRKPVREKTPAPPSNVIQKLISIYRSGYEQRFQEPPVILKRDGPLLKSLVSQFGEAKVEQRLRAFLEWTDPFVVDSGFALTVFHSNWNRLAAKCVTQAQSSASTREMSTEKTAAYLRALKNPANLKAVGR